MKSMVNVENLTVSFHTEAGLVKAVRGVSFFIKPGEILALVGESGCGKSVTAQSLLGLLRSPPAMVTADDFCFEEINLLSASEKQMEILRRERAGMVFQDSLSALNPTMPVGKQITEGLYRSRKLSKKACEKEAVRLLQQVQIPQPELRAKQYPHEFSGGMRQRALIAMALASRPRLLIADEPVTALDVTVQLQILKLLKKIPGDFGTAILFITHDLSVVAHLADRVAVMYAGKLVEISNVFTIFQTPAHPYTQALLDSLPTKDQNEKLKAIPGNPPELLIEPVGCAFAPRCKYSKEICTQKDPKLRVAGSDQMAACWKYDKDWPKEGEG